jgi:MSHA biogenesis protein MshK
MMKVSEPAWLGVLCGLLLIIPTYTLALDDPTRPPHAGNTVSEMRPLTNLLLESILISSSRRVAVINGQTRVKGQVIDGIRIRQIYHDRVEVSDNGQVRVLYLNKLPQVRGFQ